MAGITPPTEPVQPTTAASTQQEDFVPAGRLLDGFLVLASGGFSLPDDVVKVNLSSLDISEISDDLRFFPNLDQLDISDNRLNYREALEHVFVAPRITKLNLSCNSIATLTCRRNPIHYPSTFYSIQNLDLSFNELHGDILINLAVLPELQVLNLTANCVSSIPPEESLVGFTKLEELILDSNDLVQFDQWRSLDCLPKLRRLSLAANRIRRLRDDDKQDMFQYLVELDLRNNDFKDPATSLTLLHTAFRRLQKLQISEIKGAPEFDVPKEIQVETERTPSWYMVGNGSFAARHKSLEKQARSRRPFRFIDTSAPSNEPMPSFGNVQKNAENGPLKNATLAQSDEALQEALYADAMAVIKQKKLEASEQVPAQGKKKKFDLPAIDLIGKQYDDATLDDIFKKRREQIDTLVNQTLQPPKPFMRAIPFGLSETSMPHMLGGDADETFVTQVGDQPDVEQFFTRFTDEELLETPRTPREILEQNQARAKNYIPDSVMTVDVPIDVKRSLEALKEAMEKGTEHGM